MQEKNNTLLHHIATGAGFIGLVLWFYLGKESGFLNWAVALAPEQYTGSALMVGIMIMMTPGFFCWKLYVRWFERKLDIKGIYYEDSYYGENPANSGKRGSQDSAK
ncbi:hypothetical protein [Marinobacterium jannaschii]|uniref:hypothetical protein n=1 Tax=Marinobacterium jannaschii TaxID=64970 RepID=UPI0005678AEB|nr:hypothetical protein [Marinobacterium jannaschii]